MATDHVIRREAGQFADTGQPVTFRITRRAEPSNSPQTAHVADHYRERGVSAAVRALPADPVLVASGCHHRITDHAVVSIDTHGADL
jgi:hypothetical protein